jgi:hypothetical protein
MSAPERHRLSVRRLLISLVTLAALLIFAIPAAAVPEARIGPRINVLLGTPTTFPADQAFHIAHGWTRPLDKPDEPQLEQPAPVGRYSFRLEVDGQADETDFFDRWVDDDALNSTWVHNFPNGLSAGTHTFSGYWSGPCAGLVVDGYVPGPCEKQNEVLLAGGGPVTLTIEFTPAP